MRGGGIKITKYHFDNFSHHFRQFWAFLIFMICPKIFGGSLRGGGGWGGGIQNLQNLNLTNFLSISSNLNSWGVPGGGYKNSKISFWQKFLAISGNFEHFRFLWFVPKYLGGPSVGPGGGGGGGWWYKIHKISIWQIFLPFQAICNFIHFYDFFQNPKIGGVPHGRGGRG